jgi:hypothetical protein
VFTFFHHNEPWTARLYPTRGIQQIVISRKLPCLSVVDHQDVDTLQELDERIAEAERMKRVLEAVSGCECPTFTDCSRAM